MKLVKSGVYRVKNLINGKVYFGSCADKNRNVESRLHDHKVGSDSNIHLQNSIQKYGIENFIFEVIAYCGAEKVLEIEQLLLNLVRIKDEQGNLGEIDKTLSYNINPIASNTFGSIRSTETRAKISKSNKGKIRTEETKKRISEANKGHIAWNKGMPRDEETKKKISEKNKGRKLSEETKKKIGEGGRGRKHSEETKKKMSDAQRGSKNHRFGKHLTKEARKKVSETHKGKIISEETRKKMSEARKRYYEKQKQLKE